MSYIKLFITETPGREVYFESGLRQKINPTETKKRIKIFYHNFFRRVSKPGGVIATENNDTS